MDWYMYFNEFFLDQVLTVNKIYVTGLNIYEFFGTNVNTYITEIFGTAITFFKKFMYQILILKELDGCGHFDTCTILVSL